MVQLAGTVASASVTTTLLNVTSPVLVAAITNVTLSPATEKAGAAPGSGNTLLAKDSEAFAAANVCASLAPSVTGPPAGSDAETEARLVTVPASISACVTT